MLTNLLMIIFISFPFFQCAPFLKNQIKLVLGKNQG